MTATSFIILVDILLAILVVASVRLALKIKKDETKQNQQTERGELEKGSRIPPKGL